MKIPIIEINQPIGTFYISKLPASLLIDTTVIIPRGYNLDTLETEGGVQRVLSSKRVKEIKLYTSDTDATFPTPIIIAVNDNDSIKLKDNFMEFNENEILGEVIDGQHRLEGLRDSEYLKIFEMPIILMFYLTETEKAYVFSIINSKQTQVPKSLIYDLFALTRERTPQKTCHEIARSFNSDENSPYYKRLKMLGKKEHEESAISQGSFVTYLLPLFSRDPDKDLLLIKRGKDIFDDEKSPLKLYFLENNDDMSYKILLNLFSAVSEVFPNEWEQSDRYILSKTTGFGAITKAFPFLYERGDSLNDLSKDFFMGVFSSLKKRLHKQELELTSNNFFSNQAGQNKLANEIRQSI